MTTVQSSTLKEEVSVSMLRLSGSTSVIIPSGLPSPFVWSMSHQTQPTYGISNHSMVSGVQVTPLEAPARSSEQIASQVVKHRLLALSMAYSH